MLLLFLGDSFGHADSTGGTYKTAEVTAYALGANDAGLARLGVETDSLMATIHTRGIAASTTNTLITVNHRIDNGIAVQVGGQIELWQQFANQIGNMLNTPLGHVVLKAQNHVVYNTIAVLHDGCADLYVAAAQLDEFKSVAPCLNAANAAVLDILHHGILDHS